jgi:hypothetical protein
MSNMDEALSAAQVAAKLIAMHAADQVRYLVADSILKMDEDEADRQLLLEDLMTRLLELATELDGHKAVDWVEENARIRTAFELKDARMLGDLRGEAIQ